MTDGGRSQETEDVARLMREILGSLPHDPLLSQRLARLVREGADPGIGSARAEGLRPVALLKSSVVVEG